MKGIIRRIAFIYLFIKVFSQRHSRLLLSGFIIGFFATLSVIRFYKDIRSMILPNEKVIGMVGDFNVSTLPLSIQQLISIGLTTVNFDGLAKPGIAASWEATDSGKTYLFHLRPSLLWHDGKPLVASDINYQLKDAKVTPLSPVDLKIQLKQPFAPLPVVLSRPVFRENLLGLGLYRVTNLKLKGNTITLLTLTPLNQKDPVLVYKFYPTVDEAILAFKLGEVNTLTNMTSKDAFYSYNNVKITEVTIYDRFLGIFFNTKSELLKDKEARQGLSFAVPPINSTQRVYTPISSLSWAYYNKVRIYKNDPQNAKKIIEKTPLSTSSAEITLSTYAIYLPIAQKVADAWNAIGVKTKVKVETALPTDYQALLITQEIPPDPDQYQFWHSEAVSTNLAHYTNLKIDKLLEDGRRTTDLEKRKKAYADFQRYLVDDAPVALLFSPKVYTIERK